MKSLKYKTYDYLSIHYNLFQTINKALDLLRILLLLNCFPDAFLDLPISI